jgi:hypothetical protein
VEVRNRTNEVLTWATMSNPGHGGPDYITWEWIYPGQGQDRHQHEDDVILTVASGKVPNRDYVKLRNDRRFRGQGYVNTHGYLIVNGGRTVVDWSVIRDRYISKLGSTSSAGDAAVVDRSLEATSWVFTAISTGLTTIGPAGALPSGLFSLIASMLTLGQAGPPAPPDITEIERVVTRVVERVIQEELQKDNARKAASKFLRAQKWLLSKDRAFRSAGDGKGGTQTDTESGEESAQHFKEELEGWAAPSGDFQHYMDVVRADPEIAKWMFPAFLAGIAAYIQIWRLHALLTEPITTGTIGEFRDEVDSCRKALIATSEAWNRYCDNILVKESIFNVFPESSQVKDVLTQVHTGTRDIGPMRPQGEMRQEWIDQMDPTPVGRGLRALKEARESLTEDLAAMKANKPPKHFWKESWGHPRTK